jgi:large subunit ribosomal protein L1
MTKLSKRSAMIDQKVEKGKKYALPEAIALLKETSQVKFPEGEDVAIKLGVDVKKSDQVVRGAVVLPHGTGRTVRVAVFAQGEHAQAAEAAGADRVGFQDLADEIKGGDINYDVLIATPDAMPIVGKLGQILGPRGLMPNPKVGTVSADPATAVRNAKAGQARYRTDKSGLVHCSIGKLAFEEKALIENLETLLTALKRAKPAQAKGIYLQKICLSTTMGPGLVVDCSALKA